MKKPKVKTLQQIYDFCLLDATFRFGLNVPVYHKCTPEQRKYYYESFGKHQQSREGTYYPIQRENQLHRFMGIKRWEEQYHRFFIHSQTYEIVNRQDYEIWELIYVCTKIGSNGVYIEYTHPFNHNRWIRFSVRSHRPYTIEGCKEEVLKHIDKHLFYPPGRFRDLQIENKIVKEDFIERYKDHKRRVERQNEQDYWDMVETYSPDNSMSFDESIDMLRSYGYFHVLGANNEFEQEELAEEFMNLCNR